MQEGLPNNCDASSLLHFESVLFEELLPSDIGHATYIFNAPHPLTSITSCDMQRICYPNRRQYAVIYLHVQPDAKQVCSWLIYTCHMMREHPLLLIFLSNLEAG